MLVLQVGFHLAAKARGLDWGLVPELPAGCASQAGVVRDPSLLARCRERLTDVVPWASVEPEALGDAYQRLLTWLDPAPAAKNRRRRSGAYFTPVPVVDGILDLLENLEPDASSRAELGVWDPSCGAGFFLTAIARRLADDRPPARWLPLLHGTELDPVGCAVTAMSLGLLAGRSPGLVPGVMVGDATRLPGGRNYGLILGNPPYGRGARGPGPEIPGHAAAPRPSNRALWFLVMAATRLSERGTMAMVLPKGLSYVASYQEVRDFMERSAGPIGIADLGRGFSGVGLEQLVLVARRGPMRGRGYRTFVWHGSGFQQTGKVADVPRGLGTWPMYPESLEPVARIRAGDVSGGMVGLGRLCRAPGRAKVDIFRGIGVQSKKELRSPGGPGSVEVLGGRNIAPFTTWSHADEPRLRCDGPALERAFPSLARQRRDRIVCKNVVSSLVRVEATLLPAHLYTLDTITNLVLHEPWPMEYVLGILNHPGTAAFIRDVLFNRATLTMHLDSWYLSRIPIPVWTAARWQVEVVELVRALLATPARKFSKRVTNLPEVHGPILERVQATIAPHLDRG